MSERLFDENKHYVGEVVSQDLTKSKAGAPLLVLQVELTHLARDKDKIGDKDAELPGAQRLTRTLWMNLDPGGAKLGQVMKELKGLGFEFTEKAGLRPLHPSYPKHHSFLGKKVLMRVWYADKTNEAGAKIGETDKWFLVTPKETFELDEFNQLFEDNAEAYANAQ